MQPITYTIAAFAFVHAVKQIDARIEAEAKSRKHQDSAAYYAQHYPGLPFDAARVADSAAFVQLTPGWSYSEREMCGEFRHRAIIKSKKGKK